MSSAKNTAFRVELTSNALLDLEAIYGSIQSPANSRVKPPDPPYCP